LATTGNVSSEKRFSQIQLDALSEGAFREESKNMSMVDFIKLWVRREDGIDDLIGSLNVLYGLH